MAVKQKQLVKKIRVSLVCNGVSQVNQISVQGTLMNPSSVLTNELHLYIDFISRRNIINNSRL